MPNAYRREIRLSAVDGCSRAEMADDFHHFVVAIGHDCDVIEAVTVESIRIPWSTCAAASIALERLSGRSVRQPLAIADRGERHDNCTHMLDLAGLAVAHALEPGFHRTYRAEVSFAADRWTARLQRDGALVLDWPLIQGRLADGRLPAQFEQEPAVRDDDALLEAVSVLGRAVRIAGGRFLDMDAIATADGLGPLKPSCHTLQPAIRSHARRVTGSSRDFSGEGRWPLAPHA